VNPYSLHVVERRLIPGDSPYDSLGFSRVVVVGSHVYVAGTAPIPKDGSSPPEGAYEQARLCLEIIETALERAGASVEHVVRTRVYLADRSDMEEVGKAHAEVFSEIRPANTTVVTKMVDPAWKLEIDVDALIL
jgi:enamine deaminase RidA (YjgF/YER057c/UK114 family)